MRTIVGVTSHPDQRSALALKALRAMLFRRIISIWWAPITRSCWPPASCQPRWRSPLRWSARGPTSRASTSWRSANSRRPRSARPERAIERADGSPEPRASPGASARTAAPTPTPEATIRKKVGTTVAYLDGWKLTVAGFANVPPQTGTFASTPSPGNRFVKLTVRYDNGTAKEASFNALDWKMQDSAGVRRSTAFAFVQLSDELNSGRLAPGGFVTGSILFELPASEQHAVAIYESVN